MSTTRRAARPPLHCVASLVPLLLLLTGCLPPPPPPDHPAATTDREILRQDTTGPILLVLESHPITPGRSASGLRRAAMVASRSAPCSAAAFHFDAYRDAQRWVEQEMETRRTHGRQPRVILAGQSFGGAEASEIAKDLLRRTPDIVIDLLVTIDAVKSTTLGTTTGITTTLLTLNNPLPGKEAYFIAYQDAPRVDGRRLRAHTNYYQTDTTLYHGGPMPGTQENHHLQPRPEDIITHGNADDYAYPLVLADLRHAMQPEGAP